jgi:hypothetical protein
MRPGSVCRHLKIAGRVIITRFFHTPATLKLATHPFSLLLAPPPVAAALLTGAKALIGKANSTRSCDLYHYVATSQDRTLPYAGNDPDWSRA